MIGSLNSGMHDTNTHARQHDVLTETETETETVHSIHSIQDSGFRIQDSRCSLIHSYNSM